MFSAVFNISFRMLLLILQKDLFCNIKIQIFHAISHSQADVLVFQT